MADFSEEQGGLFRYEDFASYTDEGRDARLDELSRVRDLQESVREPGPDGALRAQHPRRLRSEEDWATTAPDYIHISVEAVKLAIGDREKFLGDTDFVQIPYDGLLSKAYARERRDADRSRETRRSSCGPAIPAKFMRSRQRRFDYPWHVTLEGEADHEGDTSYLAVVDKDRNMVSFEPSLHSGFGTGVVMGDLGYHLQLPRRLLLARRRAKPTRSRPASGRAARCRARS